MATAINYRELYFEYKELTRIEGEPTAEHLIRLNKELKANALSVYSNLGGAQHGHLFLVMTPAQFGLISVTPFVRPAHPGTLVIQPGTTQLLYHYHQKMASSYLCYQAQMQSYRYRSKKI